MLRKAKQYNFFTKIYNRIVDEINSLWGGVDDIKDKIDNIKQVDVWWDIVDDDNKAFFTKNVSIISNSGSNFYIHTVNSDFYMQPDFFYLKSKGSTEYNDNFIQFGFLGYSKTKYGIGIRTYDGIYIHLFNNANIHINSVDGSAADRISFSYHDFQILRTMIDNYNSQNA